MQVKILLIYLLILSPLFVLAQEEKEGIRAGNKAYLKGDYEKAKTSYENSLKINPEYNKATFNKGNANYRTEKYADAGKDFESAIKSASTKKDKAMAYHNYGNALLKARQYEKSIEAYKNALRNNPNDQDTRYNLSYAMKKLQQQQQQEEKKNQDKDQEKEDEEKNQDQQDQQEGDQSQENKEKGEQNEDSENKDEKERKEKQAKKEQSKQEAEQTLQMLNAREQEVQKDLQKKKRKVKIVIEKDW